MHGLLTTLLRKRGIETTKELDADEKLTFDNWDKILSKEELTLEDVKQFCQAQIDTIQGKWQDLNITQANKAELIPYQTIYTLLLRVIASPKSAREQLEQQLISLTK
jgi:hypothetical protein